MAKKKVETFLEEEEVVFIKEDCKELSKELGVDVTRSSWIRKAVLFYKEYRDSQGGE